MDTIIGADAAKLAGLQIDQLQKVRKGRITLEHIEWFNGLLRTERDKLSGVSRSDPRFKLVKTLDILVPADYVHATRLTSFAEAHRSEFYYYDSNLTDQNFGRATTQLKPGQRFKVDVFQIKETVTSENCMVFLHSQKALLVGAQGASIVYEQERKELPKNRGYISFDEKENLWQDADGRHRVPHIDAHSGGAFYFRLGYFGDPWRDVCCLLSFRDAEPAAAGE